MMIRSSKNLSSDLECFVLEEMKGKRKRRNNEQCKSWKKVEGLWHKNWWFNLQ